MKKFLARLSLFLPHSLFSTKYLVERIELLSTGASTCDHEWWVVASILNTVELQVQCYRCNTYSVVPDPTKEEWDASYEAMENPYRWHDTSRIGYCQENDAEAEAKP